MSHEVHPLPNGHGQTSLLWTELNAARRRVTELKSLLRRLEWSGRLVSPDGTVALNYCPVCCGRVEHNADCALVAALGEDGE